MYHGIGRKPECFRRRTPGDLTVSADRAASRTVVVTQGSEGEGTDYAVVLSPDSLELPPTVP